MIRTSMEATRVDRTAGVVHSPIENAGRFHSPKLADPTGAARYIDAEWSPDKVRERYEWLFEYKTDEVPV